MATRNSRRRSKNVIDLESSGDELELTSSSEEEVADAEEESDDSDGEEIDNDEEDDEEEEEEEEQHSRLKLRKRHMRKQTIAQTNSRSHGVIPCATAPST